MYIYLCYNRNNQVIYVGQTDDLKRRFEEHKKDIWWPEVSYKKYDTCDNDVVEAYEIKYIRHYRPIYNIEYNKDMPDLKEYMKYSKSEMLPDLNFKDYIMDLASYIDNSKK